MMSNDFKRLSFSSCKKIIVHEHHTEAIQEYLHVDVCVGGTFKNQRLCMNQLLENRTRLLERGPVVRECRGESSSARQAMH